MIIEIKDMPIARNVKKISFDIEFEDGQTCESNIEKTQSTMRTETFKDFSEKDKQTELSEPLKISAPIVPTSDRPKKEVPPEMTNLEF